MNQTKLEVGMHIQQRKMGVLWDFPIQTDHVLQVYRPDILVNDKDVNHTWIIDTAMSGDGRAEEKKCEKVEKHLDLAREIQKLQKTSAKVMSIVIGALGAVSSLDKFMSMLDIGKKEVDKVQFSVLLETARILRKVLDISCQGSNQIPTTHTSFTAVKINRNNNTNNNNSNKNNNDCSKNQPESQCVS